MCTGPGAAAKGSPAARGIAATKRGGPLPSHASAHRKTLNENGVSTPPGIKRSVDQAHFHQTCSSAPPDVLPLLQPRAGTRCSHMGFAGQAPVLQRRAPRSPKSPEFDRALIVLNLQTPLSSIFSSLPSCAGPTLLSVAYKSSKITAVHVITQLQCKKSGKRPTSSCLSAFLLGEVCCLNTDIIFQILLHVCYRSAMHLTQGEQQFVQQVM